MALSPLNQRRWRNFKANRRAFWSLLIFAVLYGLSLFAEVLANDKPLLVSYRGEYSVPFLKFYPETAFGGDFQTEAKYRDPEVRCLIRSPAGTRRAWMTPMASWPRLNAAPFWAKPSRAAGSCGRQFPTALTPSTILAAPPPPPDAQHWLGTDDTARDVTARVIYGFRLSVSFALIVTFLTSVIGVAAGAVQGYFGGWLI